jgi:HlyD family secretion protein
MATSAPSRSRKLPFLLAAGLLLTALVLLWMRPEQRPAYQVVARPLVQQVVATGRVISTSRSQAGSEIVGTVLERHVSEGDEVQPGQLLVTLRATDLEAAVREAEAALQRLGSSTRPEAQARLRQAEAQLAQATREARRREDLFTRQLIARESMEQAQAQQSVAQATLDAARATATAAQAGGTEERQLRERLAAARAQLARTFIRAQRAGVVLTRNVEPGDLVQPGRVLFEIAHVGSTEIEVPVDEKNLSVLQAGQPAQCIADAWPDRPFAATVNYIAPGVDATRGTVTVRLRVDSVPEFLRQDMTVSVNIETGRREQALAVPNDALLAARDGRPVVLAVNGGRVSRQVVTLGLRGVAMTEVTGGLTAGDWVLADAASLRLADGARVRLLPQEVHAAADLASEARREPPVSLD